MSCGCCIDGSIRNYQLRLQFCVLRTYAALHSKPADRTALSDLCTLAPNVRQPFLLMRRADAQRSICRRSLTLSPYMRSRTRTRDSSRRKFASNRTSLNSSKYLNSIQPKSEHIIVARVVPDRINVVGHSPRTGYRRGLCFVRTSPI